MATALTQTFNQEAEINHPKTEPILVDVRDVDGQKQYVVHEFSRLGAVGSLIGLGEEDDIETYSAEEYQKEYGDNPPRTLEEYKAEYDGLEDARREALVEAVSTLEEIGFDHMVERSDFDNLDRVESTLKSRVNDMYAAGGDLADVAEKIDKAVTESEFNKYQASTMSERLNEIGTDMKDHGEAVPEVIKGFEP